MPSAATGIRGYEAADPRADRFVTGPVLVVDPASAVATESERVVRAAARRGVESAVEAPGVAGSRASSPSSAATTSATTADLPRAVGAASAGTAISAAAAAPVARAEGIEEAAAEALRGTAATGIVTGRSASASARVD